MTDLEITIEGLKEAVDIEERGIDFYTRAAEGLNDPNGSNTLTFLAKEEERHKEAFLNILAGFARDQDAQDLIDSNVRLIEKPAIFPDRIQFTGTTSKDNDIIHQAKEMEKRSMEFYTTLREKVTGKTYRKLFSTMISMEESHLNWLEYIEDGLNLNGYWSDLQDYFANE